MTIDESCAMDWLVMARASIRLWLLRRGASRTLRRRAHDRRAANVCSAARRTLDHLRLCVGAERFGRRELEADSGELLRCSRGNDPSTVGGFDQGSKLSVDSGHDRPGRRHVVEDLVLEHRPEKRVRPCAQHAHVRSGQVSRTCFFGTGPWNTTFVRPNVSACFRSASR